MYLQLFFKTEFSFKSLYLACIISAVTLTQAHTASPVCAQLNNDLARLSRPLAMSAQQAQRYRMLGASLQQAQADSRSFRCTQQSLNTNNQQQCGYILSSIERIRREIGRIEQRTPNRQQDRIRRQIYQMMREHQCNMRDRQRDIIIMTPSGKQSVTKKRTSDMSKSTRRPMPSAVTPQTNAPPKATNDPVKAEPAILQRDAPEAHKNYEHSLGLISKNGLKMLKSKTAEPSPPPIFADPIDYVHDPNVRRVGPVYVPAQKAAKDQQAPAPN